MRSLSLKGSSCQMTCFLEKTASLHSCSGVRRYLYNITIVPTTANHLEIFFPTGIFWSQQLFVGKIFYYNIITVFCQGNRNQDLNRRERKQSSKSVIKDSRKVTTCKKNLRILQRQRSSLLCDAELRCFVKDRLSPDVICTAGINVIFKAGIGVLFPPGLGVISTAGLGVILLLTLLLLLLLTMVLFTAGLGMCCLPWCDCC